MNVVLCDDNADLRGLLELMLRLDGHDVVGTAADGQSLLDVLAHTDPDIVLVDLHMPDGMGLDALPRIRELAAHARVLVLSGFSAGEMETIAMERGADGFVQKGDLAGLRDALAYGPLGPSLPLYGPLGPRPSFA